MGLWAFYFIAKFYLTLDGRLHVHALPNVAFFLALYLPAPGGARIWARLRSAVLVALAALLLWHDSFFPPLSYALDFMLHQGGLAISPAYLLEFLKGYFNLLDVSCLSLLFIELWWLARHKFRLDLVVVVVLGIAAYQDYATRFTPVLDADMARFYQNESRRAVVFPARPEGSPFDIVLLQVCSLSWDDLKTAGEANPPFFDQFQLVFKNYNSVTSASAPAALRLLRSPCGQEPHEALYHDVPANCYLLDDLRADGYATHTAWNGDGDFFVMNKQVQTLGHADAPADESGLPVTQISMKNSPRYDSYAVLERSWRRRLASPERRSLQYFDTFTLHAGERWVNDPEPGEKDPVRRYKVAVDRLFEELQRYFDLLRASGRNVVVVFVPEHGRALRGRAMQGPDLREIPLPPITNVPLAIKLIGKGFEGPARPQIISKPASLLAVAYLLAAFLEHSPFDGKGLSAQVVADIPETPWVAHNLYFQVMEKDGAYYYRGDDNEWRSLPLSSSR